MYRKRHYKTSAGGSRAQGAHNAAYQPGTEQVEREVVVHAPSAGWVPMPETVSRMVAGDLSLGITFWWYGLGIPALIVLLAGGLAAWSQVRAVMDIGVVLLGILAPVQALGVWRCAERYSGPEALATVAQMLACANVVCMLVMAIAGYVTGNFAESLEWLASQQSNR